MRFSPVGHVRTVLAALLGCALAPVGTLAAEPAPAVSEIVQKAVARDDFRRLRRVAFEADQTVLTENLDTTGKILSSKTVHAIHHPTAKISFSTDVGSAAAAPSAHPEGDSVKAQHIMAMMDLGKLAPKFTESVAGSAVIQNRECYVVKYYPKPGQSADTREEKVANQVSGRFWIAKDNFDILQSDGSLVEPVTVALIVSVTRMDFKYFSQTLPNGDVGPAKISVDIALHAPFYDSRQLQVNTLANWRPRR